jgi:hypothetical protein
VVAERLKLTRPIKGAGAGLDDDRTPRNVANDAEQLLAKNSTLVDRPAAPVDPCSWKTFFAKSIPSTWISMSALPQ